MAIHRLYGLRSHSNSSRFDTPPGSVCILRLSAIGDTCHVLPVVRTLQRAWPDTRFTWIIGRVEAKLLGHIPDIEFIVLDKSRHLAGSYRTLRAALRGRHFDVLMHMQVALRASLLSTLRPGADQARLRPQAGARAAVAVHHQPHPRRRSGST